VSPQTPLIPPFHPLLSGGYGKAISLHSFLLAYFQWVFCVFTCNHPPQQTLHPEPSALPSSQAFREEGPFTRYIRSFSLYCDISFDMYRSPCRPKQSAGHTGETGGRSPTEGVLFTLTNPKSRICRLIAPPSSSRGWRGRGKAEGQGDGEVCRRGGCKVASQMTTAYVSRAIERYEDTACSICIAVRDCSVHSGALCEDTSATAPGSAFEYPPCIRYKYSPFLIQRMERFVERVVAKCMKQMTTAYVSRATKRLKDVASDIRMIS